MNDYGSFVWGLIAVVVIVMLSACTIGFAVRDRNQSNTINQQNYALSVLQRENLAFRVQVTNLDANNAELLKLFYYSHQRGN